MPARHLAERLGMRSGDRPGRGPEPLVRSAVLEVFREQRRSARRHGRLRRRGKRRPRCWHRRHRAHRAGRGRRTGSWRHRTSAKGGADVPRGWPESAGCGAVTIGWRPITPSGLCSRATFQATVKGAQRKVSVQSIRALHEWGTQPMNPISWRRAVRPPSARRLAGRRASRSQGQAIVELALILPIFLILLASALDLGRMFYSQISVNDAAREAALEASRNPTSFIANTACTSANKEYNRVMCRATNEARGGFVTIAPGERHAWRARSARARRPRLSARPSRSRSPGTSD